MSTLSDRLRKNAAALGLVAAGLVGGGVIAGTAAAHAADGATGYSSTSTTAPAQSGDQSKSQRTDETLLTGTNATKARAAALAKYPGATIQRVETDSDGVYEAHIVTKDGQQLIVQMDKSFTVTGTDSHGGPGGGRGHGGAQPGQQEGSAGVGTSSPTT